MTTMTVDGVEWEIEAGDTSEATSQGGILQARVSRSSGGVELLELHEVPDGVTVSIPLQVARALIVAHDSLAHDPHRLFAVNHPVPTLEPTLEETIARATAAWNNRQDTYGQPRTPVFAPPVAVEKSWVLRFQSPSVSERGWSSLSARAVASDSYGHVAWLNHHVEPTEVVFESREDDIGISVPLQVVEQLAAHHRLVAAAAAVAQEHSSNAALSEPLFPGLIYPKPDHDHDP